jgi:hypothetical protein
MTEDFREYVRSYAENKKVVCWRKATLMYAMYISITKNSTSIAPAAPAGTRLRMMARDFSF